MTDLFFVQLQPALSEWRIINVEIQQRQQIGLSVNSLQPHIIRCRSVATVASLLLPGLEGSGGSGSGMGVDRCSPAGAEVG